MATICVKIAANFFTDIPVGVIQSKVEYFTLTAAGYALNYPQACG
ncbi:hypothetical protein GCHA_4652 [Paraglaciecola chathamensis S18K6]|uniref:Uncharacterized protein n=2 Tax=Paraglaciecola chathamensis TaxID=368405 RepID=A0ABQ0I0T7_9ALTE|nr:hypothetical protein GAGA_0068 [Paraglaciecola agarilytica NO2]GAC12569.1 hypothetical protein GCHA_4652 [Paraglaciecola chathamensis S18K6]